MTKISCGVARRPRHASIAARKFTPKLFSDDRKQCGDNAIDAAAMQAGRLRRGIGLDSSASGLDLQNAHRILRLGRMSHEYEFLADLFARASQPKRLD
jgi:hypothetical protein